MDIGGETIEKPWGSDGEGVEKRLVNTRNGEWHQYCV